MQISKSQGEKQSFKKLTGFLSISLVYSNLNPSLAQTVHEKSQHETDHVKVRRGNVLHSMVLETPTLSSPAQHTTGVAPISWLA